MEPVDVGAGDDLGEPAPIQVEVGVKHYRVEALQQDKEGNGPQIDAQEHRGEVRPDDGEEEIDRVLPGTCAPSHVDKRMMHAMELPKEGPSVRETMN